jgi:hypothetical protein
MADDPNHEFGKRRPVAAPPAAQPVKRSNHVALLLMGTFAIGGGAYALTPGENCPTGRPGMAADLQPGAGCQPGGSTSSGGRGGSSSRSNFFSGDTSHSPSGTSSDSASGGVTRGGFGAFAHAFTAHFSGGG